MGVLQNRSGKVTRQFSADLTGWDGEKLMMKSLIGVMVKFKIDNGKLRKSTTIITKEPQEML